VLPARESIKTIAALHESRGEFGIVIATIGESGSLPSVNKTSTFRAADSTAISRFLEDADVDMLIRVVPSARTVVRTTSLPESGDSQAIADALSLAAEGELPSTLPAYRRAAGTINPGPRGSKAAALLTGWPERSAGTDVAWRTLWPGPQVGIAELAAIGTLGSLVGGVRCAALLDDRHGAAAVIAAGAQRTVARVSRIGEDDTFDAAASDYIRDTCALAGVEVNVEEVDGPLRLWPMPDAIRIGGLQRDRAWLNAFGIAYSAIVTWADPSPAVHSLAALHQLEPVTKPSLPIRVTQFMGRPSRAGAVLALCAVALLALPLGVAWARVKSLEKAIADEPALLNRNTQSERELAFYRLLAEKRWPMTKLLADVAGATPVGITLDTVELGQGEGLTLRGKADTSDRVTVLRENLNKLKIFEQVTTPSTSPTDGGVQFQLTARIPPGRALVQTPPIEDYAARPLVERLYGSKATASSNRNPARATSSSTRDRNRPSASGSSSTARSNGSSSRADRSERAERSSASSTADKKPLDIPPALNDSQIAKFNRTEAMLEMAKRRKAASQPGIDDTTKRRLTEEAEKAQRRMRELMEQGGGS
jgi:hypothetical protein